MKNRVVGIILLSVSLLIGFIIWLFNMALSGIVGMSCSHGTSCPMWGSINFHTYLSIGIMAFVALLGLVLIFIPEDNPTLIREMHRGVRGLSKEKKSKTASKIVRDDIIKKLSSDEKFVFQKLLLREGTIYQSELVEGDYTKVRVTRVLDRLEGKGLIERRRRGMTNIVILKG